MQQDNGLLGGGKAGQIDLGGGGGGGKEVLWAYLTIKFSNLVDKLSVELHFMITINLQ